MTNIDKAAKSQWEKSEISLQNHKNYILSKTQKGFKYPITLIDLLYISNFKGGNGTINEPEHEVNKKLEKYSEKFQIIERYFGTKELSEIDETECKLLLKYIHSVFDLTKSIEFRIDGFGVSRLSALLHNYFANLIPIIDRRVLNGLGLLIKDVNYNPNTEQVKNIDTLYDYTFLKMLADISNQKSKNIREIDRELFSIEMFDKKKKSLNN